MGDVSNGMFIGDCTKDRKTHTARADCDFLNGGAVQDGTSLEDLQVVLARVGNDGFDFSVTSTLELDVEGSGSLARGSRGQGGEGNETRDELHFESRQIRGLNEMLGDNEEMPYPRVAMSKPIYT